MLKLTNTLTRKLETFVPINKSKISFYQCGPTVYWTQHIGNLRAMVMADLIRRSLNYLGYPVTFVRNYTDVGHLTSDGDEGEDKMEKGAKREGLTPDEIADKYIKIFEEDTKSLNILEPDHKPRATEYVPQMIEMVKVLLEKGFAYTTPKAVYFDVAKFPDYNKLNRQKLEFNKEGAGKGDISDPEKKRPEDFAVWFFRTGAHKNAIQYWSSPFESNEVENGDGFPGWHIECSAMSKALLGDTIDIHMGGIEHIPVHHTNEIAQSEAANGVKFVNYWLHNEHLNVNDRKMAKSEGTGYSIAQIKEKGFEPISLRFFFLGAHYRSKQNFTWEGLEAAEATFKKLLKELSKLEQDGEPDKRFIELFKEALEDDFNAPKAIALIWEVLKSDIKSKYSTILELDKVLGLGIEEALNNLDSKAEDLEVSEEVKTLLSDRKEARKAGDFKKSDEIRDIIREKFFFDIEDSKDGEQKLVQLPQ